MAWGQKTMLSERYGYRLAPGHLSNCEFERGLEGWEATGNVTAEIIDGYSKYQGRNWYSKVQVTLTLASREPLIFADAGTTPACARSPSS